jgi:hypothetical protein
MSAVASAVRRPSPARRADSSERAPIHPAPSFASRRRAIGVRAPSSFPGGSASRSPDPSPSRPLPRPSQSAARVSLSSAFKGTRRKTVAGLPGVRTNGTSVKTRASWNPFAQNSNKAGIVGSQGRDDYEAEDVEYYFNYMGILAEEGSNDRMDKLIEAGKHPIDIILLFAAAEGDVPKIEEILEAGADPKITDLDGKTPIELAGINNEAKKDIVVKMLEAAM